MPGAPEGRQTSADDFGFASGSLDLGDGGGGERFGLDGHRLGDLAVGQDLDGQSRLAQQFLFAQGCGVDHVARVEVGVDDVQVHQLEDDPVGILEAPLRQTAEEGDLAAFEEGTDDRTGTGLLPLVAVFIVL